MFLGNLLFMLSNKILHFCLVVCLVIPTSGLLSQHDHDHHDHGDDDPSHRNYVHNYEPSFKKELPYLAAGVGLNIVGFVLNRNVEANTLEDISALDINDINSFDSGAASNLSGTAQNASDIILYTGAILPFVTLFNNNCRAETKAISYMAVETFLVTFGITNITKALVQRQRPFNYNPETPLDEKLTADSRASFFSGHTSVTTAMSIMSAKVLTDLHPDIKHKGLIWTTGAVIPAAIGFLRVKAGRHFPTDVMTGYAVGAAIGYLIPTLHKSEKLHLDLHANGIGLTLRF